MSIFILLLLFVLTNTVSSAQTYTNISLGTTFSPLTPPSSWPSPSGDFAFGFRPLDSDPSLYLLAVWYPKIPARTVVWSANGPNPVTNRSTAILTADGRLILKDVDGQAGQVTVWNAGVNYTATSASMLDTGNFVLSSAGAGPIWQTFDNPTDTILPGQILKQGTTVYARLMDDDYSPGRFQLAMQYDGSLALYPIAYPTKYMYPPYWTTKSLGTRIHLMFNAAGSVDFVLANNSKVPLWAAPAVRGDNYLRATLDPDGAFRQYGFKKSSNLSTGSWAVMNSIATDVCNRNPFIMGSGYCGVNSICIPDSDGRANCQCPPNYSFLDPARKFKGCKPDFARQTCEPGGEASFGIARLVHVNWPFSDAEKLSPMNETECAGNCLKDCFCYAAMYAGQANNGTCWKKRLPLSNGWMGGEKEITIALIKHSNSSASPDGSTEGRADWKTWAIVVSAIFCSSVVLHLVQVGACFFVHRRYLRIPPPSYGSSIGPATRAFTYRELEEATGGFSEELGRGAFGTVYKGVLPSKPSTLVAVKKLDMSLLEEAEKDFTNEVSTISQTQHKNLVRLLGFCKEGEHRLMVFEFMSNGSLNKFIFSTTTDRPEWNRRVQIALGIAGGLAYLHEGCRTQMIHCDIKPQNILLDDNLEARISDFGLAKLLRLEQTRTSTGIRGTIGYFAPEWFKNVAVTAKVDVYSFGVMLLEIVCCRRNLVWGVESQEMLTVCDWAKECYRNGRLDLLVEDDEEAKRDGLRLERFVMVGVSCVQEEPWLRPSMKKVVQMLEGSIAVSIPPNMYSIRS